MLIQLQNFKKGACYQLMVERVKKFSVLCCKLFFSILTLCFFCPWKRLMEQLEMVCTRNWIMFRCRAVSHSAEIFVYRNMWGSLKRGKLVKIEKKKRKGEKKRMGAYTFYFARMINFRNKPATILQDLRAILQGPNLL